MARLVLNDTVGLMNSPDYRDRFVAEYIQTKIRYEKLKAFCDKIESARVTKDTEVKAAEEPKHDCPLHLLRSQQRAMGEYLHILELRAIIEDVDLADAMMYLEDKKIFGDKACEPACEPVREPVREAAQGDTEGKRESAKKSTEKIACECGEDCMCGRVFEFVCEVISYIMERGLLSQSEEDKLLERSLIIIRDLFMSEERCDAK